MIGCKTEFFLKDKERRDARWTYVKISCFKGDEILF